MSLSRHQSHSLLHSPSTRATRASTPTPPPTSTTTTPAPNTARARAPSQPSQAHIYTYILIDTHSLTPTHTHWVSLRTAPHLQQQQQQQQDQAGGRGGAFFQPPPHREEEQLARQATPSHIPTGEHTGRYNKPSLLSLVLSDLNTHNTHNRRGPVNSSSKLRRGIPVLAGQSSGTGQ